jgi:hypothetical protein
MQLTGVDGNALTSAGLVQDPAEKLRRRATLADATIEVKRGPMLWEPGGHVPAIAKPLRKKGRGVESLAPGEINQNSFCRTLGSWVVAMPGCLQRCSDTATSDAFVLLASSASRGPTDLEPVNAITISPVAKIAPTMAFALSHRSNVRRSSRDSPL